MARTALVIGGGLIGVSTAWYLAERGIAVTLLERREGTALETSYANGGLVTPSQSDPWNGPGTFSQMLRWLGREDSPLLLRARALPGLWRWGLRFLLNSRAAPWWRATGHNLRLGLYSAACLKQLRTSLELEYDDLATGTLKVFRDLDALERSALLVRSLAPAGLNARVLSSEQATALEPLLAPLQHELAGAIHYPDDGSGDAHLFTRALERRAMDAGAQFRHGIEVTGFITAGDRVTGVRTVQGEFGADACVVAAGCASPALLAPLGLRLPIYPVKGYSITVPGAGWKRRLGVPLVDFGRKVVLTPLGERLRIAGTAEFAGFDTAINPRRGTAILKHALDLVPELAAQVEHSQVQHWAGLRPMTPDGPPVLGATPYRGLYLNAGHGPLGFTLAAGSGRAVADLVAGAEPEIALEGLGYGRFVNK